MYYICRLVSYCVASRSQVEARDKNGFTLLHVAVLQERIKILQHFLLSPDDDLLMMRSLLKPNLLDGENAVSWAVASRQRKMFLEILVWRYSFPFIVCLSRDEPFMRTVREVVDDPSRQATRFCRLCLPLLRLWHCRLGRSMDSWHTTGQTENLLHTVKTLFSQEKFPWWSKLQGTNNRLSDRCTSSCVSI